MEDVALEQHYSVKEVAKMFAVSENTVRRWFKNDPAVLTWGEPETRFKRAYINLRIPQSAIVRNHRCRRVSTICTSEPVSAGNGGNL